MEALLRLSSPLLPRVRVVNSISSRLELLASSQIRSLHVCPSCLFHIKVAVINSIGLRDASSRNTNWGLGSLWVSLEIDVQLPSLSPCYCDGNSGSCGPFELKVRVPTR